MEEAYQQYNILHITFFEEGEDDIGEKILEKGYSLTTLTSEKLTALRKNVEWQIPHLLLIDGRKNNSRAVGLLRWFRARPGFEAVPALIISNNGFHPALTDVVIAKGGIDIVNDREMHVFFGRVATMVRMGKAEAVFKAQKSQNEAYSRIGQSRALEASVQALRKLANEWGNVLMDIQVAASVITEIESENPEIIDQIMKIRSAITRGQQWIRDIGVFRLEAFDPRPINMRELIDNLIGYQLPSLPESLDVQVKITENVWPIDGDAELLEIAFGHLIANAVDSMQRVGTLSIEVNNVSIEEPEMEELKPGYYVRITIVDSGCGIPVDIQKKVFEPFFTTKIGPRWRGLGLSQAQFITRRHGGVLVISSEVTKGTQSTVLLPRSRDILTMPPPPPPSPTPDKKKKPSSTFLIIDDQTSIANGMARAFKKAGHHAIAINDGYEAIEIYKKQYMEIDYIVLDINLGETSGFDVHEEIVDVNPDARIVLVTGYASPDDLARVSQRTNTEILEKPFRPQALLEFVNKVFTY